jgi:hypothetical protein
MKQFAVILGCLILTTSYLSADIARVINITSPTGGTFMKGTKKGVIAIAWTTTGISEKLKITLWEYRATSSTAIISGSIDPNLGGKALQYRIPDTVNPGRYYIKIKVRKKNVVAKSKQFTILNRPIIRITAPSSHITWITGRTYTINWDPSFSPGGNVFLVVQEKSGSEPFSDGPRIHTPLLALLEEPSIPNNGNYTWEIAHDTKPGKYTVVIKKEFDWGYVHFTLAGPMRIR